MNSDQLLVVLKVLWYGTERDITLEPECDKALEEAFQGYRA